MTETEIKARTNSDFTIEAIVFLVVFMIFYLLIPIFTIVVGFNFVIQANTQAYKDFPEIYNSTTLDSVQTGAAYIGIIGLILTIIVLLLPIVGGILGFYYGFSTEKGTAFLIGVFAISVLLVFSGSFYFINSILLIIAGWGSILYIKPIGVMCLIIGFLTLPLTLLVFLAFIIVLIGVGIITFAMCK